MIRTVRQFPILRADINHYVTTRTKSLRSSAPTEGLENETQG